MGYGTDFSHLSDRLKNKVPAVNIAVDSRNTGKKEKVVIFIGDRFFGKNVHSDGQAIAVLFDHEYIHVQDHYHGFRFSKGEVIGEDLKYIRSPIRMFVGEVRAYHYQLNRPDSSEKLGEKLFARLVIEYYTYKRRLEVIRTTDLSAPNAKQIFVRELGERAGDLLYKNLIENYSKKRDVILRPDETRFIDLQLRDERGFNPQYRR